MTRRGSKTNCSALWVRPRRPVRAHCSRCPLRYNIQNRALEPLRSSAPRRPIHWGTPYHSRFRLHFFPVFTFFLSRPLLIRLLPDACIDFCSSLHSYHVPASVLVVFRCCLNSHLALPDHNQTKKRAIFQFSPKSIEHWAASSSSFSSFPILPSSLFPQRKDFQPTLCTSPPLRFVEPALLPAPSTNSSVSLLFLLPLFFPTSFSPFLLCHVISPTGFQLFLLSPSSLHTPPLGCTPSLSSSFNSWTMGCSGTPGCFFLGFSGPFPGCFQQRFSGHFPGCFFSFDFFFISRLLLTATNLHEAAAVAAV